MRKNTVKDHDIPPAIATALGSDLLQMKDSSDFQALSYLTQDGVLERKAIDAWGPIQMDALF